MTSTGEAVHAVSRLLGAAADASGPDVVRRALLREVFGVLGLSASAVLPPAAAGRGARHIRVAASAPRAPSGGPIDLATIPAVSEIGDRLAMSDAEARDELQRHAGGQFDPAVVAVLLAVLADERAMSRAQTFVPGSPPAATRR
jgi:hypothetical protein